MTKKKITKEKVANKLFTIVFKDKDDGEVTTNEVVYESLGAASKASEEYVVKGYGEDTAYICEVVPLKKVTAVAKTVTVKELK